MIKYITGVPGSGKSYLGMWEIFINFSGPKLQEEYKKYMVKDSKYKTCLNNINEFEFDSFERCHPLDFNLLLKDIITLHGACLSGATDTELKELAKDMIFLDCLIVLDEAHKHLNKKNDALIWWLSYHRHFGQDIIFLTQDLPLVNKEYKVFTELFYKVVPSSRKVFNNKMIAREYIGPQMFKTQQGIDHKKPILKVMFTLYVSGSNGNQKSISRHYFYFAFGLVGLFLVVLGYLYYSYSTDLEVIKNDNNISAADSVTNVASPSLVSFEDSQLYDFICNTNLCFINGHVFSKQKLFYILNNEYVTQWLLVENGFKYLIKTKDHYELFKVKEKKEVVNETENFTGDIIGEISK